MIPSPLESFPLLYLAKENHAKTGSAWLAVIDRDSLPAMAEAFLAARYHLEDVSGLEAADGAVAAYHFDHFDRPGRVTVLVAAPPDNPVFPSIAPVYSGAEWHEREIRDFFGFIFEGNPNFVPLLLAEDMADARPLRKEDGARAPLHALFAAEGRGSEVLKKADGFIMLDAPAPAPSDPEPAAPEKAGSADSAAPPKASSKGKPAAKEGKK